jgi:hypothetical protein
MNNPIRVTISELARNGRKPNCPDEGLQMSPKIRFARPSKLNMGAALTTRPIAIDKGKSRTRETEIMVQVPAL